MAEQRVVADFIRCDANDDGNIDIADPVWIFSELFRGGPVTECPEAADCNGDGERDLTDAIYALEFQFTGGPPPPAPYPECGRLDDPAAECPPGSTRCP